MKEWADGKRFLFDHIVDSALYALLFVGAVFLDPLLNLIRAIGLNLSPNEPFGHPYQIGSYQIAALIFSALQLIRLIQKFNQWKYWS